MVDCSTQTDADFPNPKMSYTQMMDYFQRQLGLNEEEVIWTSQGCQIFLSTKYQKRAKIDQLTKNYTKWK
jgi:hypothetical protein